MPIAIKAYEEMQKKEQHLLHQLHHPEPVAEALAHLDRHERRIVDADAHHGEGIAAWVQWERQR